MLPFSLLHWVNFRLPLYGYVMLNSYTGYIMLAPPSCRGVRNARGPLPVFGYVMLTALHGERYVNPSTLLDSYVSPTRFAGVRYVQALKYMGTLC